MQFLILILERRSGTILSVYPYSVGYEVVFLPRTPGVSRVGSSEQGPRLYGGFSVLFFYSMVSQVALLQWQFESQGSQVLFSKVGLPFGDPTQDGIRVRSRSHVSIFLPKAFFV